MQEVKPFEKLSNLTLWMYYGFKSMKGVAWKRSVQLFKASMFTKTVKKIEAYKIGKNRRKNYTRFTIMERGKKRDISAPHIEDR